MGRALNLITKPATTPKPGRLHWWPDTGRGLRAALTEIITAEVSQLATLAAGLAAADAGWARWKRPFAPPCCTPARRRSPARPGRVNQPRRAAPASSGQIR